MRDYGKAIEEEKKALSVDSGTPGRSLRLAMAQAGSGDTRQQRPSTRAKAREVMKGWYSVILAEIESREGDSSAAHEGVSEGHTVDG